MTIKKILPLTILTPLLALCLFILCRKTEGNTLTARAATQEEVTQSNLTIAVFREVLAGYSDDEIDAYFDKYDLPEDKRIIAAGEDKGGFSYSLDDTEGITGIMYTKEGLQILDLSDHSKSATIREIKEALKSEN